MAIIGLGFISWYGSARFGKMAIRTRLGALLMALLIEIAAAKDAWLEQEFTVLQNGTYMFNLLVGTPPQQVSVDIDYGSADLWIHAGPNPCATGCDPAGLYMNFNPNVSLTYQSNQSFSLGVRASDGSYVSQAWGWEDVQIAGTNISQTVVAVGDPEYLLTVPTQSDQPQYRNLLGLGPRGLEACVLTTSNGSPFPTYDSLLYKLKSDNVTQSTSFSIWVDPITKATGRLLLGAMDESLYTGTLESAPIINFPNSFEFVNEPMYLGIPLNGLFLQLDSVGAGSSSFNGALLYSQTVGIMNSRVNFSMPQPWLSALGTALGAVWSERLALYLVRCDITGMIGLQINDFTLRAPIQDFMVPAPGIVDATGQPVCMLQIGLANDVFIPNLFLQNYYVVVDYDSAEILFGKPVAATNYANIKPASATPTSANRKTMESLLNSEIVTMWLTDTISDLAVPTSVSQAYILGGEPQPTRITGSLQTNSKLLPKATDASNGAVMPGVGGALGLLLMML